MNKKNPCAYLKESKNIFLTLAQQAAFGLELSFERHHGCKYWFKTTGKH